ncbi:hypothetical protein ANCDUO_15848, partial [Ancylostoma duodenale]
MLPGRRKRYPHIIRVRKCGELLEKRKKEEAAVGQRLHRLRTQNIVNTAAELHQKEPQCYGPSESHSKNSREDWNLVIIPLEQEVVFADTPCERVAMFVKIVPLYSIMVRANPKCDVIIEMLKGGLPSKKISSLSGAPIRTVQNTIKRLMEIGTSADRPSRGRKPTVLILGMIKTVRELIRRSPRRSMRKIATNLGIAATS